MNQLLHTKNDPPGLLHRAKDWDFMVDIGKQLKIPEDILVTSLRPDMVLISRTRKELILIELTVPWEDRIEEAHGLK